MEMMTQETEAWRGPNVSGEKKMLPSLGTFFSKESL